MREERGRFHIVRVATIEADAAGFDFIESRKKREKKK
jgi:hypothetical protein